MIHWAWLGVAFGCGTIFGMLLFAFLIGYYSEKYKRKEN